jgi:hypothetical protein
LGWENPPEGAKDLQGYVIGTKKHISPIGCMGFHRNLNLPPRERGKSSTAHQEQRTAERGKAAHRGGRGGEPKVTGARPGKMAAGGDRRRGEIARHRELGGWETESSEHRLKKKASGLARAGGDFLKREMGTPDSLQWLSGAHRTAHSRCPVNHRTAHREKGTSRAAAGAPDIAQCSVRCTPDCPVSPDRGDIGIF